MIYTLEVFLYTSIKLVEALSLTGGKTFPKKYNKIFDLYARGDIDYDVALYEIKKEYARV